jgi:hypothetical protein
VTSIDEENGGTSYAETRSSYTEGRRASGPTWADVLVESSLHPASWAATEPNDRTGHATVNTEIVADSGTQGKSIGLDTLSGIKIQTEHLRKVDMGEGQP